MTPLFWLGILIGWCAGWVTAGWGIYLISKRWPDQIIGIHGWRAVRAAELERGKP